MNVSNDYDSLKELKSFADKIYNKIDKLEERVINLEIEDPTQHTNAVVNLHDIPKSI